MKSVIAAVAAAYVSAIVSTPNMGMLQTVPVVAVLSAAAGIFCQNRLLVYVLSGAMAAMMNLLYGFGMKRAVFVFIIYIFVSFLSVLALRAARTAHFASKKKDAVRRKKSEAVLAVSLVLAALAWNVSFGNVFGALIADNENKDYIKGNYGDNVKAGYTYYDAFERAYLTNIAFEGADNLSRYYVSAHSRDDYKKYLLDKMVIKASQYFEKNTTIDADGVKYYLDTDSIQLTPDSNFDDYKKEFEYLIPVSEKVTGIAGFKKLCGKISSFLYISATFDNKSAAVRESFPNTSGIFDYKTITVCALGTEKNTYTVVFTPDGKVSYTVSSAETNDDIIRKYQPVNKEIM